MGNVCGEVRILHPDTRPHLTHLWQPTLAGMWMGKGCSALRGFPSESLMTVIDSFDVSKHCLANR